MADKRIIFFTDNAAIVAIINNQTSKHQGVMVLLRVLLLRCRRHLTGLLNSTLTASSRRLYQRAWVVFRQFYAHLYGSTNPPLPLPPTCIPLFISYLSEFRKLACSTIKAYLSVISYAHNLKGFNDPPKSFLLDKL